MASTFIFPLTTGRSGTVYLANLIAANIAHSEVYHERAGFLDIGVHHPDASHFTQFNTVGMNAHIASFWEKKFNLIAASQKSVYAEMSHPLAKAGLLENIQYLCRLGQVKIVILRRELTKIMWSLVNRMDFRNSAFTWLYYLDPSYRNVILGNSEYLPHAMPGSTLWYIHEMLVRTEYYRVVLKDIPNLQFVDVSLEAISTLDGARQFFSELGVPTETVTLPAKANATEEFFFDSSFYTHCEKLANAIRITPDEIANRFIDAGRSLASPTA